MTDDETLNQIKDDLAAITPGTWELTKSWGFRIRTYGDAPSSKVPLRADMDFIAKAPERIAVLLDEVEELRKTLIASNTLALKLVEELALKCDDPIHDQQLLELAQQAAELRGKS